MHVFYGFPQSPPPCSTQLSIGNFDGVHLGHQTLIEDMKRAAHSAICRLGVLTFDPHPLEVLASGKPISRLTTMHERLRLLSDLGLEFAVILPFTEQTQHTSARGFVSSVQARLRMAELWVGPDFAMGHRAQGDVTALTALGDELGFKVQVIPHYRLQGKAVHSSSIRELLLSGDVQQAARFLGRPYGLPSRVASLDRTEIDSVRHRQVEEAPGAHLLLRPTPRLLVPKPGLYIAEMRAAGRRMPILAAVLAEPTCESSRAGGTVAVQTSSTSGLFVGQEVMLDFLEPVPPPGQTASGSPQGSLLDSRNDTGPAAPQQLSHSD